MTGLRIAAGRFKGSQLANARSVRSRPMSGRVKGALFNALGDISGLVVLDAFGGSGALALEAVSRGAARAVICENDKAAAKLIEDNINRLEPAGLIRLYRLSVYRFLAINQEKFDLIFVDPPHEAFSKLQLSAFLGAMRADATMVISAPRGCPLPEVERLELLKRARYGRATLVFYKRLD